mgnify:CR=1 FL=1
MACKLQPKIIPYRIILEGSFSATTSLAPILTIEADINNLTTLLSDEELSKYIRAICDISISDTTNMRVYPAAQLKNADLSSNIISFDINLLEELSFDWRVPHTDILCETYIMVDTAQMSEDYSIEISDDYKDMKGEVEKTYIIQDSEINSDLIIMDIREVVEAPEEINTDQEVGSNLTQQGVQKDTVAESVNKTQSVGVNMTQQGVQTTTASKPVDKTQAVGTNMTEQGVKRVYSI